jgi:hypothetical protein
MRPRKKRQPVTDECVLYAVSHGAAAASQRYGNHPAAINRALRVRGLGRGTLRGPQLEAAGPAGTDEALKRCGYRTRDEVKEDLRRYA